MADLAISTCCNLKIGTYGQRGGQRTVTVLPNHTAAIAVCHKFRVERNNVCHLHAQPNTWRSLATGLAIQLTDAARFSRCIIIDFATYGLCTARSRLQPTSDDGFTCFACKCRVLYAASLLTLSADRNMCHQSATTRVGYECGMLRTIAR